MNSKTSINACLDLVEVFYEDKKDGISDIQSLDNYEFIAYNCIKNEYKKHKLTKIINFKINFGNFE